MLYGLPGINNHIHNERSNSEALFHYDSKQNWQVTLGFHIIVPVDSFAQICPRYLKMCDHKDDDDDDDDADGDDDGDGDGDGDGYDEGLLIIHCANRRATIYMSRK